MNIPYDTPLCEEPLLQGDIIRWHRPREISPREIFGIVINADCDIFNDKAGEYLTYIPLLTLQEYMNRIWAPQAFGEMISKKILEINTHIGSNISIEAIKEVALSENIDENILRIVSGDEGKIPHLKKLLKHFEEMIKAKYSGDKDSFFNILCDVRSVVNGKPTQETAASMKSQFRSHLNDRNQNDCFFLSQIPGIEERGFSAAIRYFRTIGSDQIVMSKAEWYSADSKALRIGRLKPVLKYALSQKFSSLFLRIGLPKEYEDSQKSIVSSFGGMEAA